MTYLCIKYHNFQMFREDENKKEKKNIFQKI